MKTAKEVVEAIVGATTRGKKGAARRLLNQYVAQQEEYGSEPIRTISAIKAVITRYHGSKHNGMF